MQSQMLEMSRAQKDQLLQQLVNNLGQQTKTLDFLREIMTKHKGSRTMHDIQRLVNLTNNLEFFQKLNHQDAFRELEIHAKLCRNLKIYFKRKGHQIFTYQSQLEYFYILFVGKLLILNPKPMEHIKKEQQNYKENYIAFMNVPLQTFLSHPYVHSNNKILQNVRFTFKKILIFRWFQMQIKKLIYARYMLLLLLERKQNKEGLDESYEVESSPRKKKKISCHGFLFQEGLFQQLRQAVKENVSQEIDLQELHKPFHYFHGNQGKTFGESQQGSEAKNSSVICTNDSIIGVLSQKSEYEHAIKIQNQVKLTKKIQFLVSNVFNQNQIFSNEKLARISLIFEKIKLPVNEYLLKAEKQFNSVYLIKKGEVELFVKNNGIGTNKICQLSTGDFVGDEFIFYYLEKSSYFARTKEIKNSIYKVNLKDYLHLISDDPYLFKYLKGRAQTKFEFIQSRMKKESSFPEPLLQRIEANNLYRLSSFMKVEQAFQSQCMIFQKRMTQSSFNMQKDDGENQEKFTNKINNIFKQYVADLNTVRKNKGEIQQRKQTDYCHMQLSQFGGKKLIVEREKLGLRSFSEPQKRMKQKETQQIGSDRMMKGFFRIELQKKNQSDYWFNRAHYQNYNHSGELSRNQEKQMLIQKISGANQALSTELQRKYLGRQIRSISNCQEASKFEQNTHRQQVHKQRRQTNKKRSASVYYLNQKLTSLLEEQVYLFLRQLIRFKVLVLSSEDAIDVKTSIQ